MPSRRLRSIVFDCRNPVSLARFWAETLRYTLRPYDEAEIARLEELGYTVETDPSVVIDPPDGGPTVWFNRVPEAKAVKNRVHLDVNLSDRAEVDDLIARGAQVVREPTDDEHWYVMADPEGNEFCAFPPKG
jgi:hypothetical protein